MPTRIYFSKLERRVVDSTNITYKKLASVESCGAKKNVLGCTVAPRNAANHSSVIFDFFNFYLNYASKKTETDSDDLIDKQFLKHDGELLTLRLKLLTWRGILQILK